MNLKMVKKRKPALTPALSPEERENRAPSFWKTRDGIGE